MNQKKLDKILEEIKNKPDISFPATRSMSLANKIKLREALLARLGDAQSPKIETLDVKNFFKFDRLYASTKNPEISLYFEQLFAAIVNYVAKNDKGDGNIVLKFSSFSITPNMIESLAKLAEESKYLVKEKHINKIKTEIRRFGSKVLHQNDYDLLCQGDYGVPYECFFRVSHCTIDKFKDYSKAFEKLQQANGDARTHVPIATEVKPFYRFATACYTYISAMLRTVFPNRNSATSDTQGNVPLAVISTGQENDNNVVLP